MNSALLVFVGTLVATIGVASMAVATAYGLRPYRTDLQPGQSIWQGRSAFVQLNVFNPANYSEDGMRGLKRLYGLAITQVILMAVLMLSSFYAFAYS